MAEHWIMAYKLSDPETGEVKLNGRKSFPARMGAHLMKSGNWQILEKIQDDAPEPPKEKWKEGQGRKLPETAPPPKTAGVVRSRE